MSYAYPLCLCMCVRIYDKVVHFNGRRHLSIKDTCFNLCLYVSVLFKPFQKLLIVVE